MSELEDKVATMIRQLGYPEPKRQAKLIPGRKYQCDFVWDNGLVLEVEGGEYGVPVRDKFGNKIGSRPGRHTSGKGFVGDIEKYNLLTARGWKVYRIAGSQIDGYLPQLLEMMFDVQPNPDQEERGTGQTRD